MQCGFGFLQSSPRSKGNVGRTHIAWKYGSTKRISCSRFIDLPPAHTLGHISPIRTNPPSPSTPRRSFALVPKHRRPARNYPLRCRTHRSTFLQSSGISLFVSLPLRAGQVSPVASTPPLRYAEYARLCIVVQSAPPTRGLLLDRSLPPERPLR